MHIKKIIVEKYKAISQPIEIDLSKNSLIPIIGINECGKTTILNSIFAFDFTNDSYDKTVKHLTDVHNLYSSNIHPAKITAVIEITKAELIQTAKDYFKTKKEDKKYSFPRNFQFKNEITISRVITQTSNEYKIKENILLKKMEDENAYCREIVRRLPYILYFDDFKDSFPDKLEIKSETSSTKSNWQDITEELFKKTDKTYSIYTLEDAEKRLRNNILADVKNKLNERLTKEWSNFKLDDRDVLEIQIDFETVEEVDEKDTTKKIRKSFLTFEIVETSPEGKERSFYIRDRSKGFYWFFNFVMKLEFNPKLVGDNKKTIYLLDEPGSYLHPFAQNKLCKKLKELSKKNKVLYCTHTHYLLDPTIIPLNTIHIASKTNFGQVKLEKCNNYSEHDKGLQTAFQPIFDALYLKPFHLDFSLKKMVLVEGIYDFYAFHLFNKDERVGFIPGKGADSQINLISILIGFGIDFKVLWDSDPKGNECKKNASLFFGDDVAKKHFFTLPARSNSSKTIIQDLFVGEDLKMIREELDIPKSSSFEKTISSLFFSESKSEVLSKISEQTSANFNGVFKLLEFI